MLKARRMLTFAKQFECPKPESRRKLEEEEIQGNQRKGKAYD
jgi:hypothetical protein